MVERFHRYLKDGLKTQPHKWVDALPIVLLSIRTSVKENLRSSPGELAYGEPLCLPKEFITLQNDYSAGIDCYDFLQTLQRTITSLVPTPSSQQQTQRTHIPEELVQAEQIFVK